MADNQTMAKLLQAPTELYEDVIVIPEITANNFELKHGLINLVHNKQFFGHDKEDPHAHIRYFNKITSTMRVPNQRFDESFYEAWDRFNDLLRACPHHGFSELHQLDTFYNALNVNDQDSLNSTAGGNFLDKMPRECLKIIESKSKVRQSRAKAVVAKVSMSSSTPAVSSKVAELKDMIRALLLDKKNQSSASASSSTPTPVKAIELNCVTCGSTHSYQNWPATSGSVYRDNIQDIAKDVLVKVGVFHFLADFVVVDFEPDPRVPLILERCFLKTDRALIDVHKGELTLRIGNEAITYNLDQTSRYSAKYNQMTTNKIDVICEVYSQEVLGFSDTTASGNPTPYDDLIVSTMYPTLTLFVDSDFLLFEEADAFLAKTVKSSVDEPPEVELKDLPPYLEYAFLEGDNKLPVNIAKELGDEEKSALIKVLKSHKRAIAWKLSDIQGINPEFFTHKILMEEDYKPVPVHCVPKIGGFTVVENEENELIPTRLDTGWRVCVDYQKLNKATRKDGFPLPFMDQMLERLARNEYYCILDGFSGYFQIPINPCDQEKTTFTCPYGMFSNRRMPFGLCNASGTFQRCMLAIFHDMIEKTMEVSMDDFSVFRNSFENRLSRLDKILQRCEDANLSLNWEKSHFMVKEGIFLGHKISKNMIKVDRAKVDVIAKLPHPTTVKVELSKANGPNFKVNGHCVKHYFGGDIPQLDCPDCEVSRALSFCLSFTRASHPKLHFGNP
nr:reverse transcriptase domain-containing protein [Tanacetum cinerariifolium]